MGMLGLARVRQGQLDKEGQLWIKKYSPFLPWADLDPYRDGKHSFRLFTAGRNGFALRERSERVC